jgi:hypothetical protein
MAKSKKQIKSQSFEEASRAHWLDVGLMLCLIASLTFSLLNLAQNNLQQQSPSLAFLTPQTTATSALIINGSLQEDKLLTSTAYAPSLVPVASTDFTNKNTDEPKQAPGLLDGSKSGL